MVVSCWFFLAGVIAQDFLLSKYSINICLVLFLDLTRKFDHDALSYDNPKNTWKHIQIDTLNKKMVSLLCASSYESSNKSLSSVLCCTPGTRICCLYNAGIGELPGWVRLGTPRGSSCTIEVLYTSSGFEERSWKLKCNCIRQTYHHNKINKHSILKYKNVNVVYINFLT